MTHSSFPITLVFPPQGHFTQPYLALPCLKAYLRANGFDDVQLFDASLDAYDRFLSREELARAARIVEERLPLARYEGRAELSFRELAAFRAAAESAASADALIERIDDAKAVIRGPRFWDMEQYVPAVRTLYHSLRLFSAAHFPTQLTPHNFTMRYSIDRSKDVLAATLDEAENPFVRYYKEHVLPGLVARRPRVLGMSVIYGSQLIPALTLGRMVKRALPDCHVTAGGGFLAYIGQKLMQRPGVDACIDSLVFHEGEAPLLALCKALESGSSLADVGSLTWIDRSGATPIAVANRPAMPIRLDAAPVPDFEGLPLEKYFSPEVVLPYDVNRGCYYGECSFCTLPTVIGPGYRTRRAKTIVEHVVQLKERHGARSFDFITDCMPPGMIKELPNELLRRNADIRWWSDARIEADAYTEEGTRRLYDSGCRKLLFGFETATPRLLEMMKKGQTVDETLAVAKHCARAGISVTFYAMVGFPTETRGGARDGRFPREEQRRDPRGVAADVPHRRGRRDVPAPRALRPHDRRRPRPRHRALPRLRRRDGHDADGGRGAVRGDDEPPAGEPSALQRRQHLLLHAEEPLLPAPRARREARRVHRALSRARRATRDARRGRDARSVARSARRRAPVQPHGDTHEARAPARARDPAGLPDRPLRREPRRGGGARARDDRTEAPCARVRRRQRGVRGARARWQARVGGDREARNARRASRRPIGRVARGARALRRRVAPARIAPSPPREGVDERALALRRRDDYALTTRRAHAASNRTHRTPQYERPP
ncbi:MAG: radical SAM protein [Planctomycetes bacterium]|nr:radical SAM protein [Planctomycetota bacterium]